MQPAKPLLLVVASPKVVVKLGSLWKYYELFLMFFEPRPGIVRSQSSLSSMQTGHWAVTGESLSDRQHHNTTDIHIGIGCWRCKW